MKAIVYQGIGKIALEDVPEPKIEEPGDAIVRITASAICGTDLHFLRGTFPGVKKGRILGHRAGAHGRNPAGAVPHAEGTIALCH